MHAPLVVVAGLAQTALANDQSILELIQHLREKLFEIRIRMHLLKPMHIAMVRITMFDIFIEPIVQFFATQLTATELLVVIKHVMQCNHLCAGGEHAERTMKYQSVLDMSTSERIRWVQIMLHPNVPIHSLHCGQYDTTRLTLIVLIASCCQSQQYVQFAVSKIL